MLAREECAMTVVGIMGIGLILFGMVVLLRFPDRPGGKIAWHGAEVSSVGAGLPIIVLGLAALVLFPTAASTASGGGPTQRLLNGLTTTLGVGGGDSCRGQQLRDVPNARVVTVEEGARDLEIVGPQDSKEEPFSLWLTDGGRFVGAIKLRFFRAGELFKAEAIVDGTCQPVEDFRNAARGGDKRTLQNWDWWEMKLGGQRYSLRIGFSDDISVGHFQRVAD
jgi:hypothetical protein